MALRVLRRRDFALVATGRFVSALGDYVRYAALPFYVLNLTGSALATSTTFIVQILPELLFGSVAGVVVDRRDRRSVLIVTDLLRAVVLLPLLAVRSPGMVWVVYVVALLLSFITLFASARIALIPELVPEDELVSANATDAMGDNIARLVGPAIGGILLSTMGLSGVVIFDAATYACSGVCVMFVRGRRSKKTVAGAAAIRPPGGTGLWSDWLEGLRLLKGERALALLFLVMTISTLGESLITVLFVVFARDEFQASSSDYGWLVSARGLGGIIGTLLVDRLSLRFAAHRLFAVGLTGTGVIFALMCIAPSLWVLMALHVIIGIPGLMWIVSVSALFQARTPAAFRGRIFGTYVNVRTATMLTGMGLGASLGDALGATPFIAMGAVLYTLAGVLAFQVLTPERETVATPSTHPESTKEAGDQQASTQSEPPESLPTSAIERPVVLDSSVTK
jgi:MFS family permease